MSGTVYTGGTFTVSVNATDASGIARVLFLRSGVEFASAMTPPYSVIVDTMALANGTYNFTATAIDVHGNQATSSAVSITINKSTTPSTDTAPPTVSITSHASGSTVSGTVTLTASATDNIGVTGVQFYVDGIALGAEDRTAPYSIVWDTTRYTNGARIITARARDIVGNWGTTSNTTITVMNAPATVTYTWVAANVLSRCISCHNTTNSAGGYSYSSYNETMRSVRAGNPAGSIFYTEIQSGSMPRGGARLTSTQIQSVSTWITSGALNN